jgi:hypothetical protein
MKEESKDERKRKGRGTLKRDSPRDADEVGGDIANALAIDGRKFFCDGHPMLFGIALELLENALVEVIRDEDIAVEKDLKLSLHTGS